MTLRNESCFSSLADAIREAANGGRIVEVANSGNWGDALIHHGQAAFFRDLNIEVERIPIATLRQPRRLNLRYDFIFRRRWAVVSGSGAYRRYYARTAELEQVSGCFAGVIILPSSLPFLPSFKAAKSQIWRRDNGESLAAAANSTFCHDMAFYLEPKTRNVSKSIGILFREDKEAGLESLPPNNRDLSNEGTHKEDAERFLDEVGAYEVVHTNRLHVGIAAALLGREVHLYPSENNKLKSVYEASIAPFYKHAHFHDSFDNAYSAAEALS